jgi:hypothetical protein
MALAFLQLATQAPQPMQAAASIDNSAFSLETGRQLASGVPPVLPRFSRRFAHVGFELLDPAGQKVRSREPGLLPSAPGEGGSLAG